MLLRHTDHNNGMAKRTTTRKERSKQQQTGSWLRYKFIRTLVSHRRPIHSANPPPFNLFACFCFHINITLQYGSRLQHMQTASSSFLFSPLHFFWLCCIPAFQPQLFVFFPIYTLWGWTLNYNSRLLYYVRTCHAATIIIIIKLNIILQ